MAQIVELLEQRDETALQRLKTEYGDYCYAILYNILRDHGQTEEAMNDLWLRIWNSIPPARPQCLRAYLARVSRNLALDRLKYQRAQKRGLPTLPLEEIAEMVPTLSREQQERKELLKDALSRFVAGLSREEQRIFLRRYWYNHSIDELAEAFDCTRSRIKGILFRTRKKLRKFLEKEGYTYG